MSPFSFATIDGMKNGLDAVLEGILPGVQRPARYIGGEWNEVVKDHRSVDLTFALAFPDVYEIGMSHMGTKIIYCGLNAHEDLWAERCFCPWTDMEKEIRDRQLPLVSLESQRPRYEAGIYRRGWHCWFCL